MNTYDVPELGRVSVQFREFQFGNGPADAKKVTVDVAYLEDGTRLRADQVRIVERHLRSIGVLR